MRPMIRSVLAVAIVVAMAGMASAAPKQSKSSSKPTSHSITGTLDSATANTITVSTKAGKETINVGSTTDIHAGSKKLATSDLSAEAGHTVKVHYTESNGQKMAQSIQVQAASSTAHNTSSQKGSSSQKSK